MTSSKKKPDTFNLSIILILLFFTSITFLSLSVLFDKKNTESQIEEKFYSEFKIHLNILDKVKSKSFPYPHLIINKATLSLNNNSPNSSFVEVENLKIIMPYKYIFSKSNFDMKSIEIKNANFKFNFENIINFRNHLYYKINKPIKIKNSKFFYIDKNKNTILISPIKNLQYNINKKSNYKKFKVKGNIFDLNYTSEWRRFYDKPQETINEINFKNPNLKIKNYFNKKENLDFIGKTSINFLNEDIHFKYQKKEKQIFINSPSEFINQKIKIISTVDLNPFYFSAEVSIIDRDFKFIIDYIINYLINIEPESLGNLNGNLKLNFNNIDNKIINQGKINLNINEKKIKVLKTIFYLENIGEISSKFTYYEDKGDLIFNSKNILEIKNYKEFAKKFKLNSKKVKNINKIFFNLEKNIDSGEITISNIYLNQINSDKKIDQLYLVKNIQVLKGLLKDILN